MQNNQVLFCRSHFVDLQKPKKNRLSENYCTNASRFVCQRTEKWLQIRKRAKVASSTSNAAVGLKKLKEKHTHLDKNEPGEEMNRGMKFGTNHEIDSVATLTGKVFPFLYNDLQYFDERCVKVSSHNQTECMVVSPDGSLRNTCDAKPDLMYENKCRAPTSYNALTYYSISHYYVTQLLSEMFAYECRERLFACWSVQFIAVFHVRFDQEIWVFTTVTQFRDQLDFHTLLKK